MQKKILAALLTSQLLASAGGAVPVCVASSDTDDNLGKSAELQEIVVIGDRNKQREVLPGDSYIRSPRQAFYPEKTRWTFRFHKQTLRKNP